MKSELNDLLCVDFSEVTEAHEIYPLIAAVGEAFCEGDYKSVDYLLDSVSLDNLNELSMMCLLRTTYPARKKLGNWIALRDKCAALLPNPQRSLRGLM
jgi:hypothetical protein